MDYLSELDLAAVRAHEHTLVSRALQALAEIEGLRILGPTEPVDRGSAISFELGDVHPHDVSQVLDDRGVAVRAGHHCAWPLHRALGCAVLDQGKFLPVQHARRDRRAGRGNKSGSEVLQGDVMQLESMYQEIILDHYRHPHHKGLREPFDAQVHHVNPTCGDEITLRVTLKDTGGEPAVADVSYDALGCSISQASASVLTDLVIGKPVAEAMEISAAFLELMHDREAEPDDEVLGDAVVFAGVAKYPARIKCALLGWMAWKDATARALSSVNPERANMTDAELDTDVTADTLNPDSNPEIADLLEAMRDVVDPELGVNVVDLGLVYGVSLDAERVATVDMTLTSAACPLTDVIEDQAQAALEDLVSGFRINWVWLPPWGPEKITEDGREQLRALGFNV